MDASSPALSFSKTQRLLKPSDYQRVFDSVDRKQGGKYCTLLSSLNNCNENRLGLVVAKRKLRRAVDRNLCKRLIRESFRTQRSTFQPLDHHFDVIVLVKASAASASRQQFTQELERQWSKLIARRQELN